MSTNEFDEAALAELREDLGDAFADFACRFLASARSELEAARKDLQAGDLAGAGARAHALKGTAGYFGAVALADCLARLQRAAASGDGGGAASAAVEASQALVRLGPRIGA